MVKSNVVLNSNVTPLFDWAQQNQNHSYDNHQ